MLLKTQGVVRLATDVTVRYSQSGSAIASFSVVSSEKFKTQSGEQKENTTFIDVTAFGRLGEICNQYIRKGSKIYIDGKIKQEKWTAQDGTNRSKHAITMDSMEMLDSKSDQSQAPSNGYIQPAQSAPKAAPQPTSNIPEIDINIDEIPFNQGKV